MQIRHLRRTLVLPVQAMFEVRAGSFGATAFSLMTDLFRKL